MLFKEWRESVLKLIEETLNPFFTKIIKEINVSLENYKKLGEEDQSKEAQRLREILNSTIENIEKIKQTFDTKLTELFLEVQKNLETFFQQIPFSLRIEDNLKEIQNKWDEFTQSLLKQTPENIWNPLLSILQKPSSHNPKEEISLIFSESDSKTSNQQVSKEDSK
ncbi:MAG: hypothetical protein ACK4UJ_01445 [Leptonema sp. (in: bacteria)]